MGEELKDDYEKELDKAIDIIQNLTDNMMKELGSVEEFSVFAHEEVDAQVLDTAFVLLEKIEDMVFRYSAKIRDNENIKSGVVEISRKLHSFHYALSTRIYDKLLD